ncbi:MAG: hypothetical protein V1944_02125 [Candidatus Aenigmatarchaeota archaeon]
MIEQSRNDIKVLYFYNPPNSIDLEILAGINSARQFWSSVVSWNDYNFANTNDRSYFEIHNIYSLPVAIVLCYDQNIRVSRSENFHFDLNSAIVSCYNKCKSGECSKSSEQKSFEKTVINQISDTAKSQNVMREVEEFNNTAEFLIVNSSNVLLVQISGITDSQTFLDAVAQEKNITIISGIKEDSIAGFVIQKERVIAIDQDGNIVSVKEEPTFVAVIKSMIDFWIHLFRY